MLASIELSLVAQARGFRGVGIPTKPAPPVKPYTGPAGNELENARKLPHLLAAEVMPVLERHQEHDLEQWRAACRRFGVVRIGKPQSEGPFAPTGSLFWYWIRGEDFTELSEALDGR